MKENHLGITILGILFILLSNSCVSKKDIIYFQNDEINQEKVSNSYKTVFKPDDLLNITISAKEIEAVKDFNLSTALFDGTGQQQSYLIDNKGEIDFPILGKIKIGGLSRDEAIALFKRSLDPDYVKKPRVIITIANFKISILGDVLKPGSYTIPNERISILDAIALAGDLNLSAQRNNVLVQREENKKKTQYRVDLLSNSINTSPVFYLQQNDVIYVEQNYAKIQSASSNSNTGLVISVTGILIGLIAIIVR
ncbi:sugar transporter [Polaribacter sp. SA4-10]|uniref:polysaccharide biosynthesis/export family protein n=1 Tax=Polaribacter sp. SA4-10 TaxID=754397 RepID=UPI000B3C4C67|nr:polysaccharide biosynthesis/export family protein [Polaribacter sp. SA4-10]ARV06349.1 sugar transporter [Polaribacter sp. SA4-10]